MDIKRIAKPFTALLVAVGFATLGVAAPVSAAVQAGHVAPADSVWD